MPESQPRPPIIDPISEAYPRRHDYRTMRTVSEVIYDAKEALYTGIGYLALTVGLVAAYGVTVKGRFDDEASVKNNLNRSGDLINCPEANIDSADLEMARGADNSLAIQSRSVGTSTELSDITEQISAASSGSEALIVLERFLKTKGISLQNDTDNSNNPVSPTINEVFNLADTMITMPISLITYAGASFVITPEIALPKSKEQLELEKANGMAAVPGYKTVNEFGGTYGNNIVKIPYESLVSYSFAHEAFWHETVGHGVIMRACYPSTDASLAAINASAGGVKYLPEWNRTLAEDKYFKSGVVTVNGYGGKDQFEDVATIVGSTASGELQFDGVVSSDDGTIVDEKQYHIFRVLKKIEPDILAFIYRSASESTFYRIMTNSGDNSPADHK